MCWVADPNLAGEPRRSNSIVRKDGCRRDASFRSPLLRPALMAAENVIASIDTRDKVSNDSCNVQSTIMALNRNKLIQFQERLTIRQQPFPREDGAYNNSIPQSFSPLSPSRSCAGRATTKESSHQAGAEGRETVRNGRPSGRLLLAA